MMASRRFGHLPHTARRLVSITGLMGSLVRGEVHLYVRLRPLTAYYSWGMLPMWGSPMPSVIWVCPTAAK